MSEEIKIIFPDANMDSDAKALYLKHKMNGIQKIVGDIVGSAPIETIIPIWTGQTLYIEPYGGEKS